MEDFDRLIVLDTPRPWEVEETFADQLNHWMERAPWMGVSLAAHALAFFVLMAMPWDSFEEEEPPVIQAQVSHVEPDELVEIDEIIEEPEELPPVDVTEPTPQEAEPDDAPSDTDDPSPTPEGDPDLRAYAPFNPADFGDMIGIGGAPGGKYGDRFSGGDKGGGHGSGTEKQMQAGLEWIVAHQDADGKWDADGFMKHDAAGDVCDGAGHSAQDVGVTGLALLALLGDGNTTAEGPYRKNVARGIAWLRNAQDPDTGLFGEAASHDFIYGHAIATLAICESYYFTKSPLTKRNAQMAVNYLVRARNPYGAWRYDVPAAGDSDTSVTGWVVFALASAKSAGLVVDEAAFDGALSWFDEVSDPATGRAGYDSFGSLSSRTPANEHYPRASGEAMTAVALLSRFFLGQSPGDTDIMEKHADLLARTQPEWDPAGQGCDMYYWYYGSYAMFQMGGTHWKNWNRAMKSAVLDSQRADGAAAGSWDPVGPWGYSGGRVYSTTMMVLCLEVYFRYAKIVGAR